MYRQHENKDDSMQKPKYFPLFFNIDFSEEKKYEKFFIVSRHWYYEYDNIPDIKEFF